MSARRFYRLIKGMSADPTDIDLTRPKSSMEATSLREADGAETPLPTYPHHLLCDENGTFPVVLNDWEREVLQAEMQRASFVAWYRNPARATQDSLGIAYTDNGQIKMVRPDFLFFARQADGRVADNLVDPHGTQFSDALPKLRGLAEYASTHPHAFRRIETVARVGNKLAHAGPNRCGSAPGGGRGGGCGESLRWGLRERLLLRGGSHPHRPAGLALARAG